MNLPEAIQSGLQAGVSMAGQRPRSNLDSLSGIREEDVPPETRSFVERADRDMTAYEPSPMVSGPTSFQRAIAGIETGDYQGLEMLEFGSVRGQPAVSFTDEDGHRQVIKVTMPQWMAMMEMRSRGRKQLQDAIKLDATKKAMKPQFDNLAKMAPGYEDPVVKQAYADLYEIAPEAAMKIIGSSVGKPTTEAIYRGRAVTAAEGKAFTALDERMYGNRASRIDGLIESTNDTATRQGIGMLRNLIRPPEASSMPSEMTVLDWIQQSGMGPLAVANLIQQMTMVNGMPSISKPIVPPVRDASGEYNANQLMQFASQFNGVVANDLGWAPINLQNEMHLDSLVRALDQYNGRPPAARAGVQPTVQPRPQADRYAMPESGTAKASGSDEASMLLEQYMGHAVQGQQFDSPDERQYQMGRMMIAAYKENQRRQQANEKPLDYPPKEVVDRFYALLQAGASR